MIGYKEPMNYERAHHSLLWLLALLRREGTVGGGYPPHSCEEALVFAIYEIEEKLSKKERITNWKVYEDILKMVKQKDIRTPARKVDK